LPFKEVGEEKDMVKRENDFEYKKGAKSLWQWGGGERFQAGVAKETTSKLKSGAGRGRGRGPRFTSEKGRMDTECMEPRRSPASRGEQKPRLMEKEGGTRSKGKKIPPSRWHRDVQG